MENREIKIDELEVGDEVLIGSGGDLRYVKLLRPLKLAKQPNYRGLPYYSTVKCSMKENTDVWNKKNTLTGDGHNKERYVDFNYRTIWLLKRETI